MAEYMPPEYASEGYWVTVAEGTNLWDIANLNQYDNEIQEGQYIELRLRFAGSLPGDAATLFTQALVDHGVVDFTSVRVEDTDLVLEMQKMAVPAFTAILPAVLIVVGIIVVVAFLVWFLNKFEKPATRILESVAGMGEATVTIASGVAQVFGEKGLMSQIPAFYLIAVGGLAVLILASRTRVGEA